jgi:large subunit ribosomal protein L32e
MIRKFIRQDSVRYSKIGKNRRKLQKWRKPTGRHSKMREKRKSYPACPNIGYKQQRKEIYPVLVSNLKELSLLKEKQPVIIASRVGAKKKISLIAKAREMNLVLLNVKGDKK